LNSLEQGSYNGATVIVDFHTHVVPPWLKEDRDSFLGRDPCFTTLYSHPKAKLATADDLLSSMDQSGVDISVILNIGWTDHELCMATNDYILESAARHPHRLKGFCAVSPAAGEAALRELERCARGGARGIGELRPDIQAFDPSSEVLMAPLAEMVRQYNLVVLTHSSEPVGHRYPGKGEVTPAILQSLVSAFRHSAVVCAHWGGGLPFYALMPEVAESLRNVYFDTAATRYLYLRPVYYRVAELVGPDRILMGSDYPLISQSAQINEVNSLDISQEWKEKMLGNNALALLDASGG
jgi:hypothetical protein